MDNNEVVTEEVAAVVENNTGIEIEPLFEEQVDFDTFSKSDFRVVKVKNCEAVPKSKKLLRFTLDDGTENERTILSGVHAFYKPEELVGKTLLAIVNFVFPYFFPISCKHRSLLSDIGLISFHLLLLNYIHSK